MTGAKLDISNYELRYDNMFINKPLSQAFTKNLKYIGVNDINLPTPGYGSSDMGNDSHFVPSIHPYIRVGNPGTAGHTRERADSTITEKGHKVLINGAAALALTGYDVITSKGLLEEIKREFNM